MSTTRTPRNIGYYVLARHDSPDPRLWSWRIVRRGEPMGVKIEGHGFGSYEAARSAGRKALDEFPTTA